MAARVTQEVVEVTRDGTPSGRVTQEVAEVVRDGPRQGRLTQMVVEVLRSVSDSGGGGAGSFRWKPGKTLLKRLGLRK